MVTVRWVVVWCVLDVWVVVCVAEVVGAAVVVVCAEPAADAFDDLCELPPQAATSRAAAAISAASEVGHSRAGHQMFPSPSLGPPLLSAS